MAIKLVPLREIDLESACQFIIEGREWSTKTDTFVPPMAVIGHPDSRWFSALSEDDLLGIIGYHGINWIDGTAEIFTALAPEWRGKGFALPLVKRQIETGFQDLGLRRLTMTALEGSPSAKIAAKMGLAPEGHHPRTRLKRGTYHDSLTFGLERKP